MMMMMMMMMMTTMMISAPDAEAAKANSAGVGRPPSASVGGQAGADIRHNVGDAMSALAARVQAALQARLPDDSDDDDNDSELEEEMEDEQEEEEEEEEKEDGGVSSPARQKQRFESKGDGGRVMNMFRGGGGDKCVSVTGCGCTAGCEF